MAKGIPSVPDVPSSLTMDDVYRILEPLARIISIRQGKFDPLDRWVTQQDLINARITTQGAVESPVQVVPPTQEYTFNLTGDVSGTAIMGTGETTNMEVTSNTSSPWELISETDVTAVTELDLSWDGSLYNEVHLYLDDVQPQTDNVSLRLRVGSDDGATIHTTSKYDGVTNTYINLSIGAQNNDYLLLSGLVGNNALDAGVYGKINVFGFGASADGALIESQLGWEDGSGSGGAYWTKGVAFNIEEHIDTIRLYWSSGDFAANGKAYLYGLKKSP